MNQALLDGTTARIQALRGNSGGTAQLSGAEETLAGQKNGLSAQGQGNVAAMGQHGTIYTC